MEIYELPYFRCKEPKIDWVYDDEHTCKFILQDKKDVLKSDFAILSIHKKNYYPTIYRIKIGLLKLYPIDVSILSNLAKKATSPFVYFVIKKEKTYSAIHIYKILPCIHVNTTDIFVQGATNAIYALVHE